MKRKISKCVKQQQQETLCNRLYPIENILWWAICCKYLICYRLCETYHRHYRTLNFFFFYNENKCSCLINLTMDCD